MESTRQQQTLATPAIVEGVGYWSGDAIRVELHPAPSDAGVVFRRSDLPGEPTVPADVAYRGETPLRTSLRRETCQVDMVEHVLAALAGLRIDNCEIRVDRPEMPALDGSAGTLTEAILSAGVQTQPASRRQIALKETVRVKDGPDCWIEARPCSGPAPVWRYELAFDHAPAIGRQSVELALTPDAFRREVAKARTFLTQEDAIAIRAQGIAADATYQDLLVFGEDGPIGNEVRWPNECARHKLLDMIGDLALLGADLIADVTAHRTGHRLNAELVRAIVSWESDSQDIRRCA